MTLPNLEAFDFGEFLVEDCRPFNLASIISSFSMAMAALVTGALIAGRIGFLCGWW
ncbi:hypothetical protein [Terriglobus saanensis]|uniref:Uncharacterized protein n=1 Tax=Terriglobus saanensis (strain ATCC BAA-1853 / DSM 23119 / SP1PR4) TaxID=401053 RepID=E8V6P6_TERSS|nr:hypothetical protein [Terriglobus saanensis]ADV83848.1 hypothetical protein AciPR4_3089 [Terriglobus saanensis SP1PR4]